MSRSDLRNSVPARRLREAYRQHVLDTAVHETNLQEIFQRLRDAGVEPLLVKGWSIARLYAEPGLRPPGDIDLCVRPDQLECAETVLTAAAGRCGSVDLHRGIADLEDRSWKEVFRRSRLVRLDQVDIRILGPEDQLRNLCLHLVRHGGWRPLWLCDVGAALESLPPDFDWDYCLKGNPSLSDWVASAIGLAGQLLDARIHHPAIAKRSRRLPSWLVPTVGELWGKGFQSSDLVEQPLSACPRTWAGFFGAIRRRWPNPIRAGFKLGLSPFTRLPRRAIQAAAFMVRAQQYVTGLLETGRERFPAQVQPFDIHPLQVR